MAVDRIWDILTKATVPLLIIVGTTLVMHQTELSVIKANRFTPMDAVELERRIMAQMPPDWLREDMAELKQSAIDTQQTLTKIEIRLGRLETQ